jgi:hypothetical protein
LPESLTALEGSVFIDCSDLTQVTLPACLDAVPSFTFAGCGSLATLTIPPGVASVGDYAFAACTHLQAVYFQGNAPREGSAIFPLADNVTVYYLPGSSGWGPAFAGRPAVLWNPSLRVHGPGLGPGPGGFSLEVVGSAGIPVLIEACAEVAGSAWTPLETNLLTGGWLRFTDPTWGGATVRFYRVRSP